MTTPSTAPIVLYMPQYADWINANHRAHWSKRAKLTRAWRNAAHIVAKQHKLPKLDRAHILVEIHKTTNGRYDPANLHPTAKAIVDGLIDYGLLPDDDATHLDGPDMRAGEKRNMAGLTINITPLPLNFE